MDDEPEPWEPRPMSALAAIGWALGVTFVYVLLLQLAAALRSQPDVDFVTAAGCQVAAYLLGLFLILRVHAPDASIRSFVALRKTHPLFFALGPLLGITVKAFADPLYDFILTKWPTGSEGVFESQVIASSSAKRAVLFVLIALVSPAIEELFFRGALVQPLKKTSSAVVVGAVVTASFALIHLEWQAFLPLLLTGAVMIVLRLASGSLVPSFLMHATFNGVGFLEVIRSQTHGDETKHYVVPLVLLGVTGTAILLALTRAV
ncbi:MAG TPA: CPBP family intramembrane glutamic endopeptidase, partial [Minicystis sp.]|nr:CPBP family intramembrane glutamic endopeptidase [Minicystis sp.]